jgi:predicted transcriptional regulator
MGKKPERASLGDLQQAVMEVLWARGEATLAEVKSVLERRRRVATTTVATVISRLEQSGLVSHKEGRRARVYAAAVPRADIERTQVRRLVDRLFGGRSSDLIAHLVRESEIDDDELPRLRALLRKRRPS